MKRIVLIFTFLIPIYAISQVYRNVDVYDCDEIINELKKSNGIDEMNSKINFSYLLLLDSTAIDLVEKIDPEAAIEYREYAPYSLFNATTVGFVSYQKSIKELLIDKAEQKRIFLATDGDADSNELQAKFGYPIYIKGNTAIFEMYGSYWSQTYFARLEKNVFQMNLIFAIID